MTTKKRDFDTHAATWDANTGRVKLAGDISKAILRENEFNTTMDVMDFGCGTGLITLSLHSMVRSMTGVDSSQGMLDVLDAKIREHGISNVSTQYCDLDHGQALTGRYDAIVSSMTFHHVLSVRPLLKQFSGVLRPGGFVCVADLDRDGGTFHESNEGVFHHGFDRESLRMDFMEAGFKDVIVTTAAEVVKTCADGEKRTFSVFLMTGRTLSA